MFQNLSEKELIERRQTALDGGDAEIVAAIEDEAAVRLRRFLEEDFYLDSDDSPLFYNFLRAFAETQNTDLRILAKKSEVKLIPLLKEFDADNGLDVKFPESADIIERNLEDIAVFERENLSERPDFRQIYAILEQTEEIDDDGNTTDSKDLTESLEEAARLKTCLHLCLNSDKITSNVYFSTLRNIFETLIVTLFFMDKSMDVPLDEETLRAEFDNLLRAIEEA